MQHRDGHDVTCIFHKPFLNSPDKTFESQNFDFKVHFMDMKNPFSYLWLSRFISSNKPHVIHCHRNLALLYGFFSSRWLGTGNWNPILIINRGTTYDLPNKIVKFVFHSSGLDHIIAVSEAVKRKLISDEGIPENKISVIYGSYDDSRFRPDTDGTDFRREFNLGQDVRVVTCVAAIDRRKGIEYLIDAAYVVAEKRSDVRFFVVGSIEDKGYYSSLKSLICERDLENNFHFTGHRDDVHLILAASDVSISSSIEGEGITGALRESLAMKKPVVATNVSGNYEIIRDGDTGWLVPPRNSRALAEAILEALANKSEAARRANNGYKLVKRLCSPEVRYDKVLKLYEELINLRRLL